MALGEKLCNARLAKKLTTSQVATATHMKVQTVECLEKEDFRRIAAPIYAKGFIRLYAECVGLDPKPLIEEYLARFGSADGQSLDVDGQPRVGKLLKDAHPAAAPAAPPERDLFDFTAPAAESSATVTSPEAPAESAPEDGGNAILALPPRVSHLLERKMPKGRLSPLTEAPQGPAKSPPRWLSFILRFPVWQRAAAAAALLIVLAAVALAARGCGATPAGAPAQAAGGGRAPQPEPLRLAEEPPEPYAD